MRTVYPSWFEHAPRYHSGYSPIGLGPRERAAILQDGEEVLARDNPRNILNRIRSASGGAQDINIRNVLIDDPARIPAAMQSAPGERATMATLIKNAATVRQLVKG
jgi:hypothetical protein